MIPLIFGGPLQPVTEIPPQVALAYALVIANQNREDANWRKTPEGGAINTAYCVLRQYMAGEIYNEKTESDFARVGICEWNDIPAVVRQDLLLHFPPNWQARHAAAQASVQDTARDRTVERTLKSEQPIKPGLAAEILKQLPAEEDTCPTKTKPPNRKKSTHPSKEAKF